MKKNCKKTSQEKFKIYLKEKLINCMSNGKDMVVVLIVGLIKNSCIKMSQYFRKPFRSLGANINVKVDLSNCTTKTDLNNVNTR